MIWQHEWIDWSLIGHILAFVDRSQHIWPTDSLFPEQQNRTIPLRPGLQLSVLMWNYIWKRKQKIKISHDIEAINQCELLLSGTIGSHQFQRIVDKSATITYQRRDLSFKIWPGPVRHVLGTPKHRTFWVWVVNPRMFWCWLWRNFNPPPNTRS